MKRVAATLGGGARVLAPQIGAQMAAGDSRRSFYFNGAAGGYRIGAPVVPQGPPTDDGRMLDAQQRRQLPDTAGQGDRLSDWIGVHHGLSM